MQRFPSSKWISKCFKVRIRIYLSANVFVLSCVYNQGPRSNFWIEGAECLASQGRGGGWGNNQVPILASFFFNFFPFFFNYLAVATCSCLLLRFFRSLLVNIGKNICMLFRPNPFAFFLLDVRVRFPKITAKMLMRCS